MSLNASNFVTLGPIKSVDLRQFVDLFTGVMTDQPVTFKNAVLIGGTQGVSTAPLKLFGVTGQSGNLIELYPTSASSNPTFGFGALGNFAWGPGSPAANDTFLSRVATQNGHVTDTAGLLVEPYLEVKGNVRADGWTFTNGATITSPSANPFTLVLNQTLTFTNINERIRAMPAAGAGIAMDSLDGYAAVSGVSGALLGGNVTYDGAHWTRINNANPVAHLNLSGGALTYYTAPAAVGQDPPWVNSFTVSAAGNASVPGNFTASTFNASGHAVYIPDANCYIVTDTSNQMFLRNAVTYFQHTDGSPGDIHAANAILTGSVSAVNGTFYGNVFAYGASNNGVIYFETSNAVYIAWRPDLGALYIPYGNGLYTSHILITAAGGGNVWWEGSKQVYMHFDGSNVTMNMAGPWGFRAPNLGVTNTVFFGTDNVVQLSRIPIEAQHGLVVDNPGSGLTIRNDQLTFWTPNDPQGGGQAYRVITPSTRPAASVGGGELHIGIRLFCDGDITSGTNMHAVSFMTTSDPQLKDNAVVIPDADCMTYVRGNVPVYRYTITPAVSGGFPAPTPNDIGMMADDVYATVPEFAAVDSTGRPVSVVYGQMASLLWGALRQLDARCTAKGI